jgi:hypothetical protein
LATRELTDSASWGPRIHGSRDESMATLRGTQGERGGAPWGWIIGLVVVAVAAFAIVWWLRAGSPPVDTTGQQGVEQRGGALPEQPVGQPGGQPPAAPSVPPR